MPAPLADIDPDEFDLGIRTNVRGTFLGMKFQIPAMLDSGGGAIVNMASVAGVRAMTNLAAYVAGKAAIIGLTEVAALDYADRGIRVNVVAPGPDPHPPPRARPAPRPNAWPAQSVPMGRIGTTGEVADVVLWLCSEQSSFVTGVTVPDRRRPARRQQAAPDVPPGRGHGAHLTLPTATDHHRQGGTTMTTTTDQIHDLGARWVAAELAGRRRHARRASSPTTSASSGRSASSSTRSNGSTATAPATSPPPTLTWHDVDVRDYGDSAVTIGTQSQQAAYKGSPSNGDFRITHVFVRRDERWTIAGMQLSLTSPPAPPPAS